MIFTKKSPVHFKLPQKNTMKQTLLILFSVLGLISACTVNKNDPDDVFNPAPEVSLREPQDSYIVYNGESLAYDVSANDDKEVYMIVLEVYNDFSSSRPVNLKYEIVVREPEFTYGDELNLPINLLEGSYKIKAYAIDNEGKYSVNAFRRFFIKDKKLPTLEITAPTAQTNVNRGDFLSIKGTATDNNGVNYVSATLVPVGGTQPIQSKDYDASGLEVFLIDQSFGIPETTPPGQYNLNFIVYDINKNSFSNSVQITVK